ncbi:DUF1553 domain-containing protein [Agriterribacter sp.]|uniref:DUF1553 domain-containing protein n=1 Tax=Agriterribacter sp. TaxID=2821509 RepID=UPI002CBB352F|nr:DUF1553 domain-containing protein [Agriterribacter sp.]HTN06918.1 DUF1553 domain-containing protein [Agriterribacter sp.]
MKIKLNKKLLLITGTLVVALVATTSLIGHKRVDYNTEVKPLFNKKCITCHGGVKKESGFSVLFRSEAMEKAESGKFPIIPGDPDNSEMMRRLTSKDPEERMPYHHAPLSSKEIDMLRQWIKEGAHWGNHWAYVAVKPVEVPDASSGFWGFLSGKNDWVKNDVDHFIFDKLKEQQLQPSPVADKATLLRRVSLDIAGVPPSAAIAEQFLNDSSEDAYEKLVDQLLASPQYGEKWTSMWLDLARYADSKGYEKDGYRSIWRYRDWLIKAFNSDMGYDRFLTEQLAGDLMPGATDEQLIATAYNRNSMTNDEGGTDDEEFRTAAIIDRVNTTWETLLSTTFACVQCHSHPYDPIKHEDYYKFMAFFNNTRDEDVTGDYPQLREFGAEDNIKFEKLKGWLAQNATREKAHELISFLKTWQPAVNAHLADKLVNSAVSDTRLALRNNAVSRLPGIDLTHKNVLRYRYTSGVDKGKWTIHLDKPGGPVLASTVIPQSQGWNIGRVDLSGVDGVHDLYFTYTNPGVEKTNEHTLVYFDWFYFTSSFPGGGAPGYDSAYTWFNDLMSTSVPVVTPILMENPPDMFRTTHVFERGNWMVKGDEVQPDVPESLNPMPEGAPRNRLGLAMWLTDKKNPLTSRTIVNRIWEQLMGQGIAETLEDLGSQGIEPTHRELLDWLSGQLMNEYNWSLKKLIKTIVMSATYMQDSKVTPEMLQKDAFNRYYARGPRIRLSAEQIRDQALVLSGLLSPKMYGKSVMPYQPAGIWLSPYDGNVWEKSTGEDQYRRAVYTYWKRTAPYPTMLSFDGVAREVCVARRIRTNTPLQALATLNDEGFIEMARHFAARMEQAGGSDERQQISKGYEMAMFSSITKEKLEPLVNLYQQALQQFKQDEKKTCEMIGMDTGHNTPEKAALIVVANAMLNLDEFVTKN